MQNYFPLRCPRGWGGTGEMYGNTLQACQKMTFGTELRLAAN